ncbi:probable RNA helicase SDE3 [Telopea speciosissima]|uniref:probable RNA helicase SDE3 n=1 Tax=Telopea speciosissima TaxID=54955 RepID=UPI001CC4CE2A|nr:probable RNA helicase SDE3 [Telopea speciosissima]
MSWFLGILKRIFFGEENETSQRRNPPYSDNGINSVNLGVSYSGVADSSKPSRVPSSFTPITTSQSSIRPKSSVKSEISYPDVIKSSELPRAPGSFTPTKPPSSIKQYQSSSESSASVSKLPTSLSNPSSSLLDPQNSWSSELPRAPGSFTPTKPPSSIKQYQPSSESSASVSKLPTSLSNPSSSLLDPQNSSKKTKYVVVDKDIISIYVIPDSIKDLIKKDIVPEVLTRPLSPSTYRAYFAALLYAEDFYVEKWSNFCLSNVNLELHKASIYKKSNKSQNLNESDEHDDKMLVAFRTDLIPERLPFLLSRDFIFVRPSGKNVEPFQGILYRVVKSTLVLAEFGDDFYSQHAANHKYDISFSFNRVCLKRCHQAITAAMSSSFQSFLFPGQIDRINNTALSSIFSSHRNLGPDQTSATTLISRLTGPLPFLIEGPLCFSADRLSKTGLVIREAVLKIYRTSPHCRILINAPTNNTCDLLLKSLTVEIPESEMFRANAAFRELDDVPDDILPSCEYKGECFTFPSLLELSNFKVILSTFVSSFRVHNEGIQPGHFSHIFLLDASSATEPETMVTLANLVDENTSVVVTGALGNSSGWVRSDIARRNGLKKSYFQRLLESEPYNKLNSMFVMHL